ncbi:MAG TPA: LPXTG cell wall anchor domain-containing protein [Chloroflexota bacterium]|nr:LPXTG cell wall anchor domain-containing protein [Chloroflexota bacterium]
MKMGRTFRSQVPVFLLSALAALAMIAALFGAAAAQSLDAITVSDLTPADGSTVTAGQPVQVSGFITTDSAIALVNNQPDVTVSIDGTPTQVQFAVGSGAVRVGFQTSQTFTAGSHTLQVTAKNVAGETTMAQSTFTAVEGAAATATVVVTATTVPATATTTASTATTVPAVTTSPVATTTAVPTTVTSPVATTTAAPAATSPVATATPIPAATTAPVATATPSTPTQLPTTGGAPFGIASLVGLALGTIALGFGLRRRAR